MSDMFIVAKQVVKGCQTLAMDPTGAYSATFIGEYGASYHHGTLRSLGSE